MRLWVLKQKPLKIYFLIFFFCFSFKNNRRTNVVFVNIFLMHSKKLQNTDQKDICASIVYKAESKPKHKEQFFGGVFLLKPKTCFFGVQNSSF